MKIIAEPSSVFDFLSCAFFCRSFTFFYTLSPIAAVQCNLSGQPYWMLTDDAPDPRDLIWSNVSVEVKTIEGRKILVQCGLLIGVLAWYANFFATTFRSTFSSVQLVSPTLKHKSSCNGLKGGSGYLDKVIRRKFCS